MTAAAVIREFPGFKLVIALHTYICGKRMRADLWPHLKSNLWDGLYFSVTVFQVSRLGLMEESVCDK